MDFARPRLVVFGLLAALLAILAVLLQHVSAERPSVPVGTRITQNVESDGPVKDVSAGITINRNGFGPKYLNLGVHIHFDREAPPYEWPALFGEVTIGNHTEPFFAEFIPPDPTGHVWPVLARVCQVALGAC